MSPEPVSRPEKSLAEQVLATAPDLDALLDQLRNRPEEVIPPPARVRALVGTAHLFGEQRPEQMTAQLERERQDLLALARQAVETLRRSPLLRVPLSAEEQRGALAILTFLTRPAILVQDGDFVEPPPQWEELDRRRSRIQRTLRSVGRIEIEGHPLGKPWSGTGWVVGDGLVMTNRHVVQDFAEPLSGQAAETRWKIKPGMAARIDFAEEWLPAGPPPGAESVTYDVPQDAEVRVHPRFDLALLPVRRTSRTGDPLPDRLPLAAQGDGIAEGKKVYVVGYPARDPNNREHQSMERLFDAIFNVKRLQPGQVMETLPDQSVLLHDCSTLGGNSGSCVVDLTTNRVVALHYAGLHRHANLAVALWQLTGDPLLREAGIRFDGV